MKSQSSHFQVNALTLCTPLAGKTDLGNYTTNCLHFFYIESDSSSISYNNSQLIHDWNLTSYRLKNLTSVLSELIGIRDGYKECDGLTCDDIIIIIFI